MNLYIFIATAFLSLGPAPETPTLPARITEFLMAPQQQGAKEKWFNICSIAVNEEKKFSPPDKPTVKSRDASVATATVTAGQVVVTGVGKGYTVIDLDFPDGSKGKIFVTVK